MQTKLERHACRLLPEKEGGEQAVPGWALKQPSVSVAPLALPLLTCLSLCHCNWHSNHNNSSPLWGVGTWTREISSRMSIGNQHAQIMLALHCKWSVLWMLRAGARIGHCSDMNRDKKKNPESSSGANMVVQCIYKSLLSLCSPLRLFLYLPVCSRFSW